MKGNQIANLLKFDTAVMRKIKFNLGYLPTRVLVLVRGCTLQETCLHWIR